MGFFETLFKGFNDVVNKAVSPIHYYLLFKMIIGSWVTIRIGYIGTRTLLGYETKGTERCLLETLKLLVIMLFVMNYNGYLDFCFEMVDSFKNWISGGENIYAQLDKTYAVGAKMAGVIYDQGNIVSGTLGAFFTMLAVTFVCAAPLLILFTASITLKILTLTAPIFIGCLMFGIFKNFFTQWLNLVISNVLIYLFLGLTLSIAIYFFQEQLNLMSNNTSNNRPSIWGTVGILLIVCFATFVMCKMAVEMAKAITQVSIDGIGAATAAAAGAASISLATKSVKSIAKAAGKGINFLSGSNDGKETNNKSNKQELSKADKQAQDAFKNTMEH